MPRIESFYVFPLWVAWSVNDYGTYRDKAFGFTRDHAERRCLVKHEKRWSKL